MLAPIPIPFPGLLIRFTSYLFSSALRRHYTPQKLADLLDVKVSSEPAGFKVICSELPRAKGWVEINNLSPFHVMVLEFEAELYFPARVARFVRIPNMEVKSRTSGRFFIEIDLTDKQVKYIKKHKKCEGPTLIVNCELCCRLSSFEIKDREICIENVEFIDCGDAWKKFIH